MITQDYPLEDLDPRIPRIIELRQNGLTWTAIANEMTLSRKQIYNIRQNENFRYITLELIPKALKVLDEGLHAEGAKSDYIKMESVKEIMRTWRSLIPKRVESKNLNLSLSLQEDRQSNAWVEHLSPTEFNEFQNLKTNATQRMNSPSAT